MSLQAPPVHVPPMLSHPAPATVLRLRRGRRSSAPCRPSIHCGNWPLPVGIRTDRCRRRWPGGKPIATHHLHVRDALTVQSMVAVLWPINALYWAPSSINLVLLLSDHSTSSNVNMLCRLHFQTSIAYWCPPTVRLPRVWPRLRALLRPARTRPLDRRTIPCVVLWCGIVADIVPPNFVLTIVLFGFRVSVFQRHGTHTDINGYVLAGPIICAIFTPLLLVALEIHQGLRYVGRTGGWHCPR